MGLYYNPNPPHIGSQQPLEPKKLIQSGPPPQNPPFIDGARVPQAVLNCWTAAVVAAGILPTLPPPKVVPAAAADKPPILGMRVPLAVQIAWIPPPPPPPVAENLNPPRSGPAPTNPPFGLKPLYSTTSDVFPYTSLMRKQAIPPQNYVFRPDVFPKIYASWVPQPYVAQVSPKYIPPVVVDQVPPSVLPQAVLNSWYVQSPMPVRGSMMAPLLPVQAVVSVNFTSLLLMGVG